jgi:hypothetical protein
VRCAIYSIYLGLGRWCHGVRCAFYWIFLGLGWWCHGVRLFGAWLVVPLYTRRTLTISNGWDVGSYQWNGGWSAPSDWMYKVGAQWISQQRAHEATVSATTRRHKCKHTRQLLIDLQPLSLGELSLSLVPSTPGSMHRQSETPTTAVNQTATCTHRGACCRAPDHCYHHPQPQRPTATTSHPSPQHPTTATSHHHSTNRSNGLTHIIDTTRNVPPHTTRNIPLPHHRTCTT